MFRILQADCARLPAKVAERRNGAKRHAADAGLTWGREKEDKINAPGAQRIGEIGITGIAAALANALFHATGKRVRDSPITLDKVMV